MKVAGCLLGCSDVQTGVNLQTTMVINLMMEAIWTSEMLVNL
jgi:hypothetical protein